jgi:hypothetical protein
MIVRSYCLTLSCWKARNNDYPDDYYDYFHDDYDYDYYFYLYFKITMSPV